MKRILVILDPWNKAKTSLILEVVDKIRVYFEMAVCILPTLLKLSRENALKVFSSDQVISDILNRYQIPVIKFVKNVSDTQKLIKISTSMAREWHQYENLHSLIDIYGVNLGEAVEQELANLFFATLKECDAIEFLTNKEKPDMIYIQNIHSCRGYITKTLAEKSNIKWHTIEQNIYAENKIKLIKQIAHKRFRFQFLNLIMAHLIPDFFNKGDGDSILIDAPYTNYLDAILPFVGMLKEKGYGLYVLGKKTDISKRFKDFERLKLIEADKNEMHLVNEKIQVIHNNAHEILNNEFFNRKLYYNGINLGDALKWDLYAIFTVRFPQLMQDLIRYKNILKLTKPKVILVGDDRGPSSVRSHVIFAKSLQIPVIEIQHGIYSSTTPLVKPISNKICVWGEYGKESLIRAGAEKDQIVITGAPKFDSLCGKKLSAFSSRAKKVLLFATQPPEESNYEIIREILPILKKRNMSLIIKPHPAESYRAYHNFVKNLNSDNNVIVKKPDEGTNELIVHSDIVMIRSSTVGIHAAILDRNIIFLNIAENTDIPYREIGIEVKKIGDISEAIDNLLYDEKICILISDTRKKFVYRHTYVKDGKASKRVADLIMQMIKESKREKK